MSTFASNERQSFDIVKNTSTISQHLNVQLTIYTYMKHAGSIAFVLTFASNERH